MRGILFKDFVHREIHLPTVRATPGATIGGIGVYILNNIPSPKIHGETVDLVRNFLLSMEREP